MNFFSRIFNGDFTLSEESIEEEDEGICTYFGKSRIDRKAVLSMDREVEPNLPSRESASTGGEATNVIEGSSNERFDSELSYSLYVE